MMHDPFALGAISLSVRNRQYLATLSMGTFFSGAKGDYEAWTFWNISMCMPLANASVMLVFMPPQSRAMQ